MPKPGSSILAVGARVLGCLLLATASAVAGLTATYNAANDVPVIAASYTPSGTVNFSLNFAPPTGTQLTVVNNTGLGFISGTFSNLAHGQAVALSFGGSTYPFVANYYGGTGNDLMLQWATVRPMAWGYNNHGQLGNNSTTQSKVPTGVLQSGVLAGKTVIALAAGGYHSLALCSDGTLAAWGRNDDGQLGDNSTTNRLEPVAVNVANGNSALYGKTVIAIAARAYGNLVLCSDGTLAAWGINGTGELGNNSRINSKVPVAVNAANGISALFGKTVVAIAAGGFHNLALCSDGTLVAWGNNVEGALGDNSTTDRLVPVAVNVASGTSALFGKSVIAIAAGRVHSVALCSDGTLATWGWNVNGELGDNSTTNRSVPVSVNVANGISALFDKSVIAVAAGSQHNLALCSDGTLVTWGYNGFGQLGNNDFSGTSKLVPVAVNMANGTSALFGKTITALAAGEHHSLAQCSDGALAAWGYNGIGQVGDNSTFGRFVPVAVSSTPLAAGERFILGTSGHSASHTLAIAAALPPPPPPAPEVEVELVGSETNTPLTNEADTVPFGTMAAGSTTTQTFLIKNTGTASLDNIEVSLDLGDPDHEQFSVTQPTENSIDPDGSRTFTVTYAPNGAGSHTATLRVESNDGDESTFSVELTGTAELVPEITVRDGLTPILTNAEVELGNVIQGDFVERTFTIQNIGAADLTDLAVTIPNTSAAAAFSQIAFVAPTLATNIASTFTIRFRPSLLGAHAITIAVGSNDADENPFNIRLRGMCIAPGAVVGTPASEASAPADTIGAWATSLAGSYTGLIKDGTNTVIGRVADLKALPVIPRIRPNPTLEGNILFKGRTVAIKAVISPSGAVAATIPTSKAISTGDMQLALQFFKTDATESPVLRGTVTWLGVTATLDAITTPGTGILQLLNPAWPGRYTLALPAEDGWGNSQPGGDGYASVTIASSGAVVITGFLGDGTVFNTKSVLNPDGRMVIYHDIVRAGVSRGSIAGTLTMRDVPGVSDFDGLLQWTRIKDDGAANYRNGFSVQVWCLGNRYTAPATNVRMLSQLPPHDHNARLLVVSPFSASTPESYSLDWTAKNALKHYGPYFISSSVATPLGQLKVLSRPLSTAVIQRTMNMVCLQKQGIAVGYYSTGTLTGRCRIDPGDYPHPGSEYTGAIQRPGQPAVPAVAPAVTALSNPTTFAGTYSGVVVDDLSRMAGGLEDMIIGSSGSFTATLWLRGVRYGFTGRLFPDGTVSVSIPRTGLPSMTLTLQLYLEDGTTNGYELNGTLEASGSQYTIQSQRLPNYTTVLRSPNEGPYTLAFLAPNGVNVATEPGGDGYGNLSVSYLGVCSGTCKLADASTFTFASHVSRSGEWSLHRGIYNGKAWVAGKLTFRDVPNISDLDGEWRWEKQAGAVPASFPYSAGFAVTRPVVGCRYLAPVKGYPAFFQLPASYLNAWVRLSGPDFSTLPAVTLTARDRAMSWLVDDTLISHGPDTMKALLTRSTGVFSGTYTDTPFGVSQAIGGVLLQKQGVVTGHYLHGPASGLVVIMPKP